MNKEEIRTDFHFSITPNNLINDQNLSCEAKGLYTIYVKFANQSNSTAFPSRDTLYKLTKWKKKKLSKYKNELLNYGWITQKQRFRKNGQFSTKLVTLHQNPVFVNSSTVGSFEVGAKRAQKNYNQSSLNNNQDNIYFLLRKKINIDRFDKTHRNETRFINKTFTKKLNLKKKEKSLITKKHDLVKSIDTEKSLPIIKKLLLKKKNLSIIKKITLNKKPVLVNHDTYGIKSSKFYKDDLGSFLSKCLSYVVQNNIAPENDITMKIIKHWNNIDNQKFAHHRVTKNFRNTDTFKKLVIVTSYRMHKHNIDFDKIIDSMELFNDFTKYNRHLKYKRKIFLLSTFLWNPTVYSDIKWFESCLNSKDVAFKITNTAQPKFEKTMEKTKNHFINIFFPNKEDQTVGEDIFNNQFYKFKQFSDQMVSDHKTKEMCGMSIDRLIREYFEYSYSITENLNVSYKHSPNYILSPATKNGFIMATKNEPNYAEFWRNKKIA